MIFKKNQQPNNQTLSKKVEIVKKWQNNQIVILTLWENFTKKESKIIRFKTMKSKKYKIICWSNLKIQIKRQNSKNLLLKNLLMPKIIIFAFIIQKAWEEEEKCYSGKLKMSRVNISQIKIT